jgi:hypothetical protein
VAVASRNHGYLFRGHLLPFWFQLVALVVDVVHLIVVMVASPWLRNDGKEMCAPVHTAPFDLTCHSGNAAATSASIMYNLLCLTWIITFKYLRK